MALNTSVSRFVRPKQSRSLAGLYFRFLPLVVLLITAAISYQSWSAAKNRLFQEQQVRFSFRSNEAYNRIIERMAAYEQVLRGTQGLFAASDKVSRAEFHTYVSNLALNENFPGIQGLGFSAFVPAPQKSQHIAAIHSEGFRQYQIRPAGSRTAYAPVCYIEPFSGKNIRAFGYDLLSEPARRVALEQARDTAAAAITSKVCLVQETSTRPQAGFLMYLPVYRNHAPHNSLLQRRSNLIGWVGMPFRMDDLMLGILGGRDREIDIEIYDGSTLSDTTLMYDNDTVRHFQSQPPLFQETKELAIAGHRWTMVVSSLPAFETGDDGYDSLLIAVIGISTSVFLTLITWLLVHGRSRALQTAHHEHVMTQALRKAEKLAKVGHFDYDPRTDRTYWSEGLERIWGFEPGHPYRTFQDFIATVHPDDLPIILNSDADKSWHETSSEFRIIRADGEIRHICSYGYREFAKDGSITRVFGINKDFTDRKHAEEAIRRSRDYYLELLESFPALIWRSDIDGRCDYFNRTWLAFTGRTLDQELGDGWVEGVHPDDLQRCLQIYRAAFTRRTPFEMEYRLRHADGSYRWIVDHGSPYHDAKGHFAGYIGSCYDIDAQKNAELALKEAHEQLEQRVLERTAALTEANRQLTESKNLLNKTQKQALLGSWSWDLTNNAVVWSDELYDIFGYDLNQPPLRYREYGALFTPESYARLDRAIARILATGDASALDQEFEIIRADGSHRFCLGRGDIVRDSSGTMVQLCGSLQDITERKQLEEQLYAARTLESVGRIAAGVAHEVRNPLNAILSITEALFHDPLIEHNPDYDIFLQHIRTQVNRLSLLMNDLLALGKPIPATNLHPLPLNQLARDSVTLWQQSTTSTDCQVTLQSALPDSALVLANSTKLQQVLFNLLENACQHSPAGSAISVTLSSPKGHELACIMISDSGSGIAEGQFDKVFEPFYSNRRGGTGLGLALVKHFIENMNGTVRLWNNEPPPGCSVEVCVPLFHGDTP